MQPELEVVVMFDMLLESGHRPSLVPSWGKGVALTLHVLIVATLWRTPAAPAPVTRVRTVNLPPAEPLPSRPHGGPTVPNIDVDGGILLLPPLQVPEGIGTPLKIPVIESSLTTPGVGGPVLQPGDGVYLPSLVQEAPELLSAPAPVYPPLLRVAGVQGRVTVSAVVDTLGRAENGSVRIVLSDNPGFDAAALATVQAARFRPARIYGRAVRVLVAVPVVFRLN